VNPVVNNASEIVVVVLLPFGAGRKTQNGLYPHAGAFRVQETSFWAENSACYIPETNELCAEQANWDTLFCLLRRYCDIYAKSLADHNIKLREVLDRLRMYRLQLQPEKCEFLQIEVNYLGHQVTEAGVKTDTQKWLQL